MKNIEKYPNTKDALEAYKQHKSKNVPFDTWLECEFDNPRVPPLLEVAEAVTKIWFANDSIAGVSRKTCDLSAVIECEKSKPVRNFNKYNTPDEALSAFNKMCESRIVGCSGCRFYNSESYSECAIR